MSTICHIHYYIRLEATLPVHANITYLHEDIKKRCCCIVKVTDSKAGGSVRSLLRLYCQTIPFKELVYKLSSYLKHETEFISMYM